MNVIENRPNSVAPDRVAGSQRRRGAMLRIIGSGRDPATRVSNLDRLVWGDAVTDGQQSEYFGLA